MYFFVWFDFDFDFVQNKIFLIGYYSVFQLFFLKLTRSYNIFVSEMTDKKTSDCGKQSNSVQSNRVRKESRASIISSSDYQIAPSIELNMSITDSLAYKQSKDNMNHLTSNQQVSQFC